jgi:hypothetical protein
MVAWARYGVISNNGKTITVVAFGSVDAIYANALQELTNHYPGRDRSFPRAARKMVVVFSN